MERNHRYTGGENAISTLIDVNPIGGPFPASGKIYDITHPDTNEHSVSLPSGYPANTKLLFIKVVRSSGSGFFYVGSVSGSTDKARVATTYGSAWVRAADGLFYYSLGTADDDFDIFSLGYIVG